MKSAPTSRSPAFVFRVLCALAGFLCAFPLPASAQASDLQANFKLVAARMHVAGPALIEVDISSATSEVRLGTLEIDFHSWGRQVGSHRLTMRREVAIAGRYLQRYLVPPADLWYYNRSVAFDARFIEKGRTTHFGKFTLGDEAASFGMPLSVGIGRSTFGQASIADSLFHCLRSVKIPKKNNYDTRNVAPIPTYFAADDFPRDALGFTVFDLVALDERTFSELPEKAVVALGDWLAAGGNVYLHCEEPLGERSRRVVEGWIERDMYKPSIAFDAVGMPLLAKTGIGYFKPAFGRLVLGTRPLRREAGDDVWLDVSAFLYRVNADVSKDDSYRGYYRTGHYRSESDYFALLTKEKRRSGRTFIAAALVLLFLLAVPGEWFVLGWLRARRFTWIVFPATALALALALVFGIRLVFGTQHLRQSIAITDLAPDGAAVRQYRSDYVVPANSDPLEAELQNSAYFVDSKPNYFTRASGPYTIDGAYPSRFKVRVPQSRWTPWASGSLRIGPEEDLPEVDWDVIGDAARSKQHARLNALASAVGLRALLIDAPERMEWIDEKDTSASVVAHLSIDRLRGGYTGGKAPMSGSKGESELRLADGEFAVALFRETDSGLRIWRRCFLRK